MCYNPYDHKAMLRDISVRTENLTLPNLRLTDALGALARTIVAAIRTREQYRPAPPVSTVAEQDA